MHTLLGSCVSITLWQPEMKIGGMCHYALPKNNDKSDVYAIDPRYAEDCMVLFERSAKRYRVSLNSFEAKVFGGGNMYGKRLNRFSDTVENLPIGEKNVAAAYHLLTDRGIPIQVAHVGEFGYRRVIFNVDTGDVWVKFTNTGKIGGDMSSLSKKV